MFRFDIMGVKLVYINMVLYSKWFIFFVYLLEVKRKWVICMIKFFKDREIFVFLCVFF